MFVHLRLHTEFSVVDGTNRIDDIVRAAAADGQPALAITDLGNLFGAIKFYKEARGKGVKPLIGTEIVMEGLGKDPGVLSRMILLVQGSQGYLNLSELLARAWTRNVVKAQAVVKLEWLKELSEGLILLSGAQAGPVGQALVQAMPQGPRTWRCNWPRSFRTGSTWSCSAPVATTMGYRWPGQCNSRLG
jgi:DNA polymerase-3 subunit alpha